ncbi:MAG TPA: glycine betaine ABC transporter substrate-binding protein [Solirubrobacteraceae bacterium]|jgi:osmoprotectant transport system substrate-binding protein|nr:glycine betaine ABC transporter substrate-binding protein [Solirubrobacteraceae bacterium]
MQSRTIRATLTLVAVAAASLATAAGALARGHAAAAKPGAGKPAVTIGDKNFSEENLLGALYAQALQAKGFKVKLKDNIGSSEITWKALKAGQIDLYPEYTGTLLSEIAGKKTNPSSAKAAYADAQAFASKEGFRLLAATPFADSNVLAVKPAYAKQHGLTTIASLAKLGSDVTLGAPPEFQTRNDGLPGIKKAYGVDPTFKPVAIGLAYKSLDGGDVDVQLVFTTDGQLTSGKYVLLKDPKGVFGYQNVAPVVSKKVLAAEGPEFAKTLNAVSRLLTLKAIQSLNHAITSQKLSPRSVAAKFLKANHLA